MTFSAIQLQEHFLIKIALAAVIIALFVVPAIFRTNRDFAGGHKWRAVGGAAIEGVVVAGLAAFVLIPMIFDLNHMQFTPANELMTWDKQAVLLPAGLVMQVAAVGGLAGVPGLAFFMRPRRRAALIQRRMLIEKQIAKLDGANEPRSAPQPVSAAS